MHPNIQGSGPSACPVCGMALVPIPPPQLGEYGLEVASLARSRGSGIGGLRLVVRPPATDAPQREFREVHERLLHLFVISRDLVTFRHTHPALSPDGSFALAEPLDSGAYMLIADFLPVGGTPQLVHRAFVTPDYRGPLFTDPPRLHPGPDEAQVDGLRIQLEVGDVVALRPAPLRVRITEASTGAPVDDLEPFLGASAHLLAVNPELTEAIHGHPDGAGRGPVVAFDPVLPVPGMYKLWVQLQRNGRLTTASFVVEAR